jgi:transcriptional regulator GlxA family with amidase domain
MIGKFRAKMGTTPARYLWRFRTERGAAMLGETGLTIAEIADRCGFKSPFHFSRIIKQHFGQSPKSLRRQAWTPEAADKAQ